MGRAARRHEAKADAAEEAGVAPDRPGIAVELAGCPVEVALAGQVLRRDQLLRDGEEVADLMHLHGGSRAAMGGLGLRARRPPCRKIMRKGRQKAKSRRIT